MKANIKFKYIVLYLTLTIISIIVALKFYWTDLLTLSFLGIEEFSLLAATGIYWMATIYISILIIRKYIIKLEIESFVGPLDLVTKEYFQETLGIKKAKKIKQSLYLITFPTFIISILIFNTTMNFYKQHELDENGKIESIVVKIINKNVRGYPYIFFEYNNGKNSYHLPNSKNLSINDCTTIIYSKTNPEIVEYYIE